jgi:dihydrofolate reductase
MEKCLIVAVADNGAIGVKGDLPWHLPEDLKYFKEKTKGFPVIMGRTTYFSLPFRPLKGRKNIVLNLGWDPIPDDVVSVYSFDEAFAAAEPAPRCFVIGGASVYKMAIDMMDRLYITHVHTIISDADAFFPEINSDIWALESRSERRRDEKSGLEYEFATYVRR